MTLATDPTLSEFGHFVRASGRGVTNVEIAPRPRVDRINDERCADLAEPWPSTSNVCPSVTGGLRYISLYMYRSILIGCYINSLHTIADKWDDHTSPGPAINERSLLNPASLLGSITELLV